MAGGYNQLAQGVTLQGSGLTLTPNSPSLPVVQESLLGMGVSLVFVSTNVDVRITDTGDIRVTDTGDTRIAVH